MSTGDRIAVIGIVMAVATSFTAIAVGTTGAAILAAAFWCLAGTLIIIAVRRHRSESIRTASPGTSLADGRVFVQMTILKLLALRKGKTTAQADVAVSI